MKVSRTKKLSTITAVFWFLLLYIIAALVFWFISLQNQNRRMADLLLNELRQADPQYEQKAAKIKDDERRKTAQYIGEGATFLVVILIGAGFVFRATRRRFRLSLQQQNFMMTVTHELKTPLSVARLNLETIQKRQLEDQQKQKLLDNTLEEVNRLDSLCNNILLASRLDAGEYKSHKTEVNISAIAQRICNDFIKRSEDRNVSADIRQDLFINGEELLLDLLFRNLIGNAIKYSPRGSPVHIRLFKDGDATRFSVRDEGNGIAEEDREKIFEKFYRIGNEQTRSSKGTGLGLYLCRQIAKNYKATIHVKSEDGKGSTFTVIFRT